MKNLNSLVICLITFILLVGISQSRLANNRNKFLGNIVLDKTFLPNTTLADFLSFWNQLTLFQYGTWSNLQPLPLSSLASLAGSRVGNFLDAYKNVKQNSLSNKNNWHAIVWPAKDPAWLSTVPSTTWNSNLTNFITRMCGHFSSLKLIDNIEVFNQILRTSPIYVQQFGGLGDSQYQWALNIFQIVKNSCNYGAKFFINDYGILNSTQYTDKYVYILNLFKSKGYNLNAAIQVHNLSTADPNVLLKNLNKIAETGVQIQISQLAIFGSTQTQQLELYRKFFPLLYEHPSVTGITLWGFVPGNPNVNTQTLRNGNNLQPKREALLWLQQYFSVTYNKPPIALWTNVSNGLIISFSSAKSYDYQNNIISYYWDFGDSTNSTEPNPTKTYLSPGTYTVSLTIYDNGEGIYPQTNTSTYTSQIVVQKKIDWSKPIAYCKQKFVGSTIKYNYLSADWNRYWNQATPEQLGKWAYIQPAQDQMNWASLDFAWNQIRSKGNLFKGHTFLWGLQVPSWLSSLSSSNQAIQLEQWIKLYCQRYPHNQLINVVNQPLHVTPNYADSIGGGGSTGYDWIIWGFVKARRHCPNARLLINDYDILTNDANTQQYLTIINLLKSRNLIDGIGQSGHNLQSTSISTTQISNNLNALAATNLPIYISQFDLNILNDSQHLSRFKQLFSLFYQHNSVKGITTWGYVKGQTSKPYSWLYDPSGQYSSNFGQLQQRPSLQWLKYQYIPIFPNYTKPRAYFNHIVSQTNQLLISFDATLSQDCDGSIVMYSWSFGSNLPTASGNKVDYTFPVAGIYTVQLTIIDNDGKIDAVSAVLVIGTLNNPPTALLSVTNNGLKVKADSSASIDSDGTIQTYSVNWGDNSVAENGMILYHTYSQSGTYTINLTVFDDKGDNSSVVQTVTLTNLLPTAYFQYQTNYLSVELDATSSYDFDGTISSYVWQFDDSTISDSGKIITHNFLTPGPKTINLIVTDNAGGTSTYTVSITVVAPNQPPVSSFRYQVNGLTVSFTSTSNDLDGSISNWYWTFDDLTSSSQINPIHTYQNQGTFVVQLVVTDNSGASSTSSQTITVVKPNVPPKADFTYQSNYLTIKFTSTSLDSDGTIISQLWNVGYGGITSSDSIFTYTYPSSGDYVVSLTVVDNKQSQDTITKTIQVRSQNFPPSAQFNIISVNDLTVTVDASFSTDDTGIQLYSWNWGESSSSTGMRTSHVYSAYGTYKITLQVRDDANQISSISKDVTLINPNIKPPICLIGSCSIWYLQVSCTSSSTDDTGIANYVWSWDDNKKNQGKYLQSASHNYQKGNSYNVLLNVTNNKGLSSVCSKRILATDPSVGNNPPISVFGFWADNLKLSFWFGGWDTDGRIVSYLWQFGDGTTSTQTTPVHIYPGPGTYNIVLTVIDDKGATGTSSQTAVVVNPPKNYHVQSLSKNIVQINGLYYGQLTVKIYDNNGMPLEGVVISGQLSHPPSGLWDSLKGTTDTNGIGILETKKGRTSLPYINACAYSFDSKTNKKLWYNAGDNRMSNLCI